MSSENGNAEANRREFTRVRVSLEVEVSAEDRTTIQAPARDLSLNGVYVPCTGRLPVETTCKVELVLDNPGSPLKLEVQGRVSRADDDGMAIEFTGVPLDDLEHLRNLIRYNTDDIDSVEEEFDSHLGLKPRD